MEIGYGGDIEALPEETGRNRRIKLPPVATAPSLYSEVHLKGPRWGMQLVQISVISGQ